MKVTDRSRVVTLNIKLCVTFFFIYKKKQKKKKVLNLFGIILTFSEGSQMF